LHGKARNILCELDAEEIPAAFEDGNQAQYLDFLVSPAYRVVETLIKTVAKKGQGPKGTIPRNIWLLRLWQAKLVDIARPQSTII
jgi:hypothetical protein